MAARLSSDWAGDGKPNGFSLPVALCSCYVPNTGRNPGSSEGFHTMILLRSSACSPGPFYLLADLCGALLVGLFFAFIVLDAASGCGQNGGQCIGLDDFLGQPTALASR
jgi:hypothetical protein